MTAAASQIESAQSLRGEIEAIATATPAAMSDGALSYSFGKFAGPSTIVDAEQTVSSIVASVRRTMARLAHEASIETTIDGITARSIVTYNGRVTSVFTEDPSFASQTALAAAHLDSLQSVYARRIAFAGAVAATEGTLVAIAAAISNPPPFPVPSLRLVFSNGHRIPSLSPSNRQLEMKWKMRVIEINEGFGPQRI